MSDRSRWILAGAALALLVVAGLAVLASFLMGGRDGEWTTRSNAALEELELGIEATKRGYAQAAIDHLDRALELDPDFVAPKIYLVFLHPSAGDRRRDLLRELAEADTSRLSDRERYLSSYFLSSARGDSDEAERVLNTLLAEYPDDFLGLDIRCSEIWKTLDWEEAEECYYQLIEAHPNKVEAYHNLGYIDMAKGRFSEAEEHLRTHLFIVPDRALPYNSLAALLILLGRHEEAEQTLVAALELDQDSCWTYVQLIRSYNFSHRFEESLQVLEQMEAMPTCALYSRQGFFCYVRGVVDFLAEDFESSWSRFDEGCLERRGGYDLIGHLVAIATGRMDDVGKMRERLREHVAQPRELTNPWDVDWLSSLDAHFEGVELLAAGEYARASELLREADERLPYWTHERAGFKLLNRTLLAYSLELEGKKSQANAMLARVEAVNPRFPEYLPRLDFLGETQPR